MSQSSGKWGRGNTALIAVAKQRLSQQMCMGQWWRLPAHCRVGSRADWCFQEIRVRALYGPLSFQFPAISSREVKITSSPISTEKLGILWGFFRAMHGFVEQTLKASEFLFYFRNTVHFPFMHLPMHSCMCSHIYVANIQCIALLLASATSHCCWRVRCRCECRKLEVPSLQGRCGVMKSLLGLPPRTRALRLLGPQESPGQLVKTRWPHCWWSPSRSLDGNLGKCITHKLPRWFWVQW